MKTIFCDWGTTNLRAYLSEDGQVIQTYVASTGLRESRELGFGNVMHKVLDHFQVASDTPIRRSGMVGSKNGWKEAPYASTPADAQAIMSQSATVEDFPDLRIISGVCHEMEDGRHDVMRGEEVQVLGLLEKHPEAKTICLPGTHSKWVDVRDQAIQRFSTWMTGDFFRCLTENSIFQEQITSQAFHESAFLEGVSSSESAGHMLNTIFHLRTDYLFSKVSSDEFYSYLSGFLIGQEIKSAAQRRSDVYLCGAGALMDYYAFALEFYGICSTRVCAEETTVLGLGCFCEDNRDA